MFIEKVERIFFILLISWLLGLMLFYFVDCIAKGIHEKELRARIESKQARLVSMTKEREAKHFLELDPYRYKSYDELAEEERGE